MYSKLIKSIDHYILQFEKHELVELATKKSMEQSLVFLYAVKEEIVNNTFEPKKFLARIDNVYYMLHNELDENTMPRIFFTSIIKMLRETFIRVDGEIFITRQNTINELILKIDNTEQHLLTLKPNTPHYRDTKKHLLNLRNKLVKLVKENNTNGTN